jgi:hypothetical protein
MMVSLLVFDASLTEGLDVTIEKGLISIIFHDKKICMIL